MCGIAGVVELVPGREPSAEALARMARVLSHRGPDEDGIHVAGAAGLAHRRLSIIDLASGQQPMGTPDGRFWIAFNGEIYNFPDLKEALRQRGVAFRTTSDTEVLLHQFALDGVDAFAKIHGMFAGAFWDTRERTLVLVRDRFGKKPVFWYRDGERFLFGSEIKALLAHGGVPREVDLGALHEYLTYGYGVGDAAPIRGVRRLPPGHYLVLRDGTVTCRAYWELAFGARGEDPGETRAEAEVERLLESAVRKRLISDVPLGAFLSGGLDSSLVVAMMARVSKERVRTFTIGFEEADFSEAEDARRVARHVGSEHTEIVVKPAALEILPKLVWHLDEPFGDSSAVPTYYVCKAAREHVTVALSGDGGDEVFAGYTRYRGLDAARAGSPLPGWVRRGVLSPLLALLPLTTPGWNTFYAAANPGRGGLPVGRGIFPYLRDRLYAPDFAAAVRGFDPYEQTDRLLDAGRELDPVSRYQYYDTLQYLPADILVKVDRMSMANSLEVRAPMLDHLLVESVARLPVRYKLHDGVSKRVLRRIAARILPPEILDKRKQGFAIPKGEWFRRELRGAAEGILLDARTVQRGYFRRSVLETILRGHATGRRDYSDWIWCLLVLEMWHRAFVDGGPGRAAPGAA